MRQPLPLDPLGSKLAEENIKNREYLNLAVELQILRRLMDICGIDFTCTENDMAVYRLSYLWIASPV